MTPRRAVSCEPEVRKNFERAPRETVGARLRHFVTNSSACPIALRKLATATV